MAARKRRAGFTGGGFVYPTFSLTIDNTTFDTASAPGVLIGTFSATPLDGRIHLIDTAGGKVAMGDDAKTLVVGATEEDVAEDFTITVRLSWAAAFKDFDFTITASDPG